MQRDLGFLDLIRNTGDMRVEQVLDVDAGRVMFAEDPGDEGLRRRVIGWEIWWGREDDGEGEKEGEGGRG